MQKKKIHVKNAPNPVARYSQGILVDHTLYVQGVIALDPESGELIDKGIEHQTRRVFDSIRAIVEGAGMGMADVVKVTVFLSDLKDFSKFNEVYNSYFPEDPPPVRTTVQAKMPFGALIEAEAIASRNKA
jgi:2-iminobutanoate/2-iminopropanoate deaminase